MRKYLFIVCIVPLVLINCDKKTESVSIQFLNPNSSISSKQILELDWNRLPVDIPTFYNKNNDTMITFTLSFDSSKVISQQWEVIFNEIDSANLHLFFSKYESIIFPDVNFQELSSKTSYFTIFNYKRNIYFAGYLYRERNGKYLLNAEHNFPFNY